MVILSVPLVSMAVTVSQDITIKPKSTSGSITLASGSTFDTLTVNSNSFTFALSGSQSVTLQSGNERLSSNVSSVVPGCNASLSNVSFSATDGSSVIITMEGTACSSGGGGGGGSGGGGGGGSTSSTQTTTTTTTTTVATTPTTATVLTQTSSSYLEGAPAPAVPLGSVASAPIYVPAPISAFPGILQLNRRLSVGSSGEDVRALQEALASMPDMYPEGTVSGYFGSLTKAAVAKFQMKYGIVSSSSDAGYGSVGPMTRAKLHEVFGGAYSSGVSFPIATVSASVALTRRLNIGSEGTDVTQLQAYLAADSSLYPEGKVTGYYGSLTSAAVKRFQARYGIDQVGWVGPQTMAKLNEFIGQGASASQAPVSTGSSPSDDQARAALQSQIQDMQALINSLTQQIQTAQ